MDEQSKYPEPEGFDDTLDEIVPKVVDTIFRSFTEHSDERVRAWAQDIKLDGLRRNLGRLIAFQVRSTASQFYQVGYQNGLIKRVKASGPGERSLVSYDEKGRIKEMVKIPLSVQERLDLEKLPDKS